MNTDDYSNAIRRFCDSIRSIEREILAIYLYGSVARNAAIVSKSDIDILIIFRDGTKRTVESYSLAIRTVLDACHEIYDQGLPFDGCEILFEHELAGYPTYHLAESKTWQLLFGDDIRTRIHSSSLGSKQAASHFYNLRQSLYLPAAALLTNTIRDDRWRRRMLRAITNINKTLVASIDATHCETSISSSDNATRTSHSTGRIPRYLHPGNVARCHSVSDPVLERLLLRGLRAVERANAMLLVNRTYGGKIP